MKDADRTRGASAAGSTANSGGNQTHPHTALPTIEPGSMLGGRYEILHLLGQGGMGAVYKVRDRELDRLVVLKVIRPELVYSPDILQRFKQELILARQVTHKNVIRIYDLGEADGVKFLTMDYIEGSDLKTRLREQGKFAPTEAVRVMQQICRAVDASHAEGVIHRDLKPSNVMLDKDGKVLVMDFGLARSHEGLGLTLTGALVGTPEYMAPEQAKGQPVDAQSDIYAAGLIFYELLTGKVPFPADSALHSLMKRTQERAVPVSQVDNSVPKVLSGIVSRCLEPDRRNRYQSAAELLGDLEACQPSGAASSHVLQRRRAVVPGLYKWLTITLATVLLVAGVVAWKMFTKTRPGLHATVSVLVADFENKTSDPVFDGTLEPAFGVALESAPFINAYNRGNARQLAGKLPNPTSTLDEKASRLVAVSQGISAIVKGSLSNHGTGYRLSVQAIDTVTGKILAAGDVDAANKDDVLLQVPKVTAPIRKALGDTTPESVQLIDARGTFAASNLEAVHEYGVAMEQQFSGNMEAALRSFSKAVELDPNFGRAYAGMAAAAGNLGQTQNAEKYAKLALEHVDRMTERERYRVRGQYFIRTENWQKCIEEYSELVKQYPADNIGQNNLASCYASSLNMPKAMEAARQGLQLAPKNVMARMNFSLFACYAGDFQSCERGAREVLQLNPAYEETFLVLAYAQLGQNQLPQAKETYQKLEKVSVWGASMAASGLGDLALYQGRLRDGVQILEKGAAADLAAKKPDAAADKFVMLAYANLLRGDKQSVVAATQKALANSQSAKIRFLAARAFVEAGETGKARTLAARLASELQAAPQAYAKLVMGAAAFKEQNPKQAIQLFTQAKDLMDTWIGRFDLGRAYLEAGAFAEADSEFDRCIKRRGEALELFMDDMPTYSYLPIVYYYQGRAREGLKSPGFADSYRTYLSICGKSTEDPLLPDIRRRLGQ
jgi:tetratricopeptide (TPR) repeat protein/predicted Ser/Thr protein kinase